MVLSVSFGLGIVLLRIIQDLEVVGSKAGLKSYIFGKTAGMILGDVYVILTAALLCLAVIVLLYKEFQAVSFDPDFARSLGWPVYGIDLLLMSLVAAAVVIGLPNVGVILISALLIMPGAAARFWTDRLGTLLGLAAAFGLATGMIGTLLSAVEYHLPDGTRVFLPAGAVIVLTGAVLFGGSLLFGWRRGAVARLVQHLRFRRAWGQRQLLLALYDLLKQNGKRRGSIPTADLLAHRSWTASHARRLIRSAAADGLLTVAPGDNVQLTATGWRQAVAVVRGHRLWKAFLETYPEQASGTLSLASVSPEEHLPPSVIDELTTKLRAAGRWPEEGGGS
jgi:manganese/zinc/iron transport system permease protein